MINYNEISKSLMFLQEPIIRWFVLIIIAFIAYFLIDGAIRLLLKLFLKLSEKTETDLDDKIAEYFHKKHKTAIVPLQVLGAISIAFYSNISSVDVSNIYAVVGKTINGFTYFFTGWLIVDFLIFFLHTLVTTRTKSAITKSTTQLLPFLKVFLFIVVLLSVIQSLGINVTALFGGLAVVGMALGLAAQSFVSDVIGFVSIISTKPFEIGDYVSLGTHSGHIKEIGIKQTRLRKSTGQVIVIPNSKITSTEVNNFSRLEKIRSETVLQIVMSTPVNKLKLVRLIVENVCKEFGGLVQFICCNLTNYVPYQFDLRFNIRVICPEVDKMNVERANKGKGPVAPIKIYSETRNNVLLRIAEELERHNIFMAFPTYTINSPQNISTEFNNTELINQIQNPSLNNEDNDDYFNANTIGIGDDVDDDM